MIELRRINYDDKEYDSCGNKTVAVLEINNITIPLCEKCLSELNDDITKYNNTIFCYQCKHCMINEDGTRFSCKDAAELDHKTIALNDIGYSYAVDRMYSCKDAEIKEE